VSAVLNYKDSTVLGAKILVEGNNQLFSNQKDYARVLFDEIVELKDDHMCCIDEHHVD
jgi:hypothetical protein